MIEEILDENVIESISVSSYKKFIKSKIKSAAFKYLITQKENHSKTKEIKYLELQTQKYLVSPLFSNDDVDLLLALRSRSVDVKHNLKIIMKKTTYVH